MSNTDIIKVSVVMPIYNAEQYLRPALDTVLAQTLTELELICVDDGSTDRSLDILKEYQGKDERVRIITENNAGPSWARNKGLARARGEYIIFLDADDFYEPELLSGLYELAERDNLDIAITDFDLYNVRTASFDKKIAVKHEDIFRDNAVISKSTHPAELFECTENYVWNKLFRASFLQSRELAFNQDLRVFEDVYFIITALALADRVGKNFDILIHHRVYPEQTRTKFFRKYYMQIPDLYVMIKEFLMHHGVYLPLIQAFTNLSGSRCYKIYNVLWWDAKAVFWGKLHEGGVAEQLGWEKALTDSVEIEDEDVRQFVSSALVNTHKKEIDRFLKGLETKAETVKGKLRNMRLRKKFVEILRWIFGKPKDEK